MTGKGIHQKEKFSLQDLLNSTRANPKFHNAGAIMMFIGVVRGKTQSGETVKKLELEAYEEKANESIANICKELRKREGIVDVQIHHFIGDFNVGEDLVYVLVAGSHRHDIFPVLEEAVERYKREVPIFKKEYVMDERERIKSYWISEHKVRDSE
jgi:molybdopterin synthase catalytic subunit